MRTEICSLFARLIIVHDVVLHRNICISEDAKDMEMPIVYSCLKLSTPVVVWNELVLVGNDECVVQCCGVKTKCLVVVNSAAVLCYSSTNCHHMGHLQSSTKCTK